MTTGKITCYAQWEDIVDDPKKPALRIQRTHDVALEVTAAGTADPSKT